MQKIKKWREKCAKNPCGKTCALIYKKKKYRKFLQKIKKNCVKKIKEEKGKKIESNAKKLKHLKRGYNARKKRETCAHKNGGKIIRNSIKILHL